MFITNFGTLNFDVYCGIAPTCSQKFLENCEEKLYNGKDFLKDDFCMAILGENGEKDSNSMKHN